MDGAGEHRAPRPTRVVGHGVQDVGGWPPSGGDTGCAQLPPRTSERRLLDNPPARLPVNLGGLAYPLT
eukprot:11224444-Lingulodinium_polyedra.AAC.1